MLQTGALIRDVPVRELIALMAALYPRPLDVDEVRDLVALLARAASCDLMLSLPGHPQRCTSWSRLWPVPLDASAGDNRDPSGDDPHHQQQ